MIIDTVNLYAMASPPPSEGDPYWDYVVLLLNMDGVSGSTTFIDQSQSAHTVTANGDAKLTNSTAPLGGTSLELDGTGDFLQIADSNDWYWPLEFTIEAWARYTTSGVMMILSQRTGLSTHMFLEMNVSELISFTMALSTGSIGISDTDTTSTNTWFFVAIDRDATGKTRLYINGTMVGSDSDATSAAGTNLTPSLRIGSNETSSLRQWIGQIGPVRITKGVARYASDGGHVVPTGLFPVNT